MTAPVVRGGRVDLDALADLEEQRDFLLRSLDDLEAERAAGDIGDDDYLALKDDYTRRAAEVLRAIDEGRAVLDRPRPSRRPLRTATAVVVVAALAVGAGLAVAGAAGTRRPGETATGNAPLTLEQRLTAAARLAQQGRYADALELYDEVIDADPGNVEALSERGLLLVSLANATERPQLAAEGRRSIEAALAVEPGDARSLFYLGLAQRLMGDDASARQSFQQALDAGPDDALRRSIEEFLATAGPGGADPGEAGTTGE